MFKVIEARVCCAIEKIDDAFIKDNYDGKSVERVIELWKILTFNISTSLIKNINKDVYNIIKRKYE